MIIIVVVDIFKTPYVPDASSNRSIFKSHRGTANLELPLIWTAHQNLIENACFVSSYNRPRGAGVKPMTRGVSHKLIGTPLNNR